MLEKVKALIAKDEKYKILLEAVYNNPYMERKAILKDIEIGQEEAEKMLDEMEQEMIILELSSQANSSLESRVPKKVLLINPDIEQGLEDLL